MTMWVKRNVEKEQEAHFCVDDPVGSRPEEESCHVQSMDATTEKAEPSIRRAETGDPVSERA